MKDAQGHGSNGRSGAMARLAAARTNPNHPLGVLSRVVSQGTPIAGQDAWSNTPGGDREAASTLSSGGPKSDPVPVHDSMAGGHGQDWGDRDSNGVSTKGDYGKNLSDAYQAKHGWSGDVGAQPDHTARRAASLARVSY
jgi:hypothetical protein